MLESIPLSWPGKRLRGFQPSTLTSSEPHIFPLDVLYTLSSNIQRTDDPEGWTYGSRSQIITISSSLPLANHRPEWAHLTVRTGPVCIVNVHKDLGGLPDCSEAELRIGLVLQIRILASRPPVAMREPSGWTSMENMESRFAVCASFAAESAISRSTKPKSPKQIIKEPLCMTQDGFVKRISRTKVACGPLQHGR